VDLWLGLNIKIFLDADFVPFWWAWYLGIAFILLVT
jgi:hypothetical protein